MSRQPREAGFSLLEVIVAFSILVMTLTMFYQIYAGGMRNVFRSDAQYRAVERARSRLAMVGTVVPLSPGRSSGAYEDGAVWTVLIEPYPDDPENAAELGLLAYRVSVSVAWGISGDDRRFTLETIKLAGTE